MSGSIVRWGAAALALVAAAPAVAQGSMLEAGGVAEGRVASADSPTVIELRAAAGQTLQLDAIPAPGSPDGLDLLLKVYDQSGEVVAQDDDGGGALNPRVAFTSEAGGRYRVEVNVLGEGGAFTLLARESVIVPEVITALNVGSGKAERPVAFPADDDALFSFTGRRGEAWQITLVADTTDEEGGAADPMLELFMGEGTKTASLATDDDSGGGLNSRIVTELPETGTYTVRVSSLSSQGSARLTVGKMVIRDAPLGNLAYGAPETVSFSVDSPFIVGESARRNVPYALYRLPTTPAPRAMAGETIVITATSEGLDPYLEVGLDTPLGFAAVLSNDDTENLNARLVLDPARFAGADAEWWSKLRVRVSAPVGSTGDVVVTATRTRE